MPSTPGTIDDDEEIDLSNFLKPEYGIKATYVISTTLPIRNDAPAKISALNKMTNRKVQENYQEEIEIDAQNIMDDDDRKLWLSSKRNSKFP